MQNLSLTFQQLFEIGGSGIITLIYFIFEKNLLIYSWFTVLYHSAGPHEDPVVGLAGEVAFVSHCPIILSLGASKLQAQPDPWGEVGGAHVPHGGHLVGAGEEDLGALVQLHATLQAAGRRAAAPAAVQGGLWPAHRGPREMLQHEAARRRVPCSPPGQVHKSLTKQHTRHSQLDLSYSTQQH